MPHIVVKDLQIPKLPTTKGEFNYEFKTEGNEGLVSVKSDEYRFLLEFFPHKKGFIVKPDKITRIPNISKVKRCLQEFVKMTNSQIVHSNIDGKIIERTYKSLISRDILQERLKDKKEVWFEIGFGSGRLISHHAKENKDVTHLGVEIHKPSIEQLLKQCEIESISNILVISDDARVILETLKPNSISKIFVHFPIPWDKSPEKRVFSKNFINQAIKALKENGTLELRTDSPNYYEFVTDLYKEMRLDIEIKKNIDIAIVSKYETRWKKQAKDIYDIVYTNSKNTQEKQEIIDFSFGKYENITKSFSTLSDKAVVRDDFLVKINKIYKINEDESIIKLVMGKLSFPQAIYIKTDGNKLDYYPKKPYYTKENFLAHKEIIRVLKR